MKQEEIIVTNARENNLKNVTLRIPKYQLTVFTGVSGSGKSSLVLDTLAASSRRDLNDTFPSFVQQYLPKYGRPHVERVENMPVAIVIDQKKPAPNLRSTLGTYTDAYTLLRLLYSRAGSPFVGYSDTFSFNHPAGSCPRCNGLGEVTDLDIHKLVDFDKCLNDPGVIHYAAFEPGQWRWIRYARSGLFDLDKKIRDYTPEEHRLFFYSPQVRLKDPPPLWPKSAKYEGLVPRMYRSVIHSEEGKLHAEQVAEISAHMVCPECHGARLNKKVLTCLINGKNIDEAVHMPLSELYAFVNAVDSPLAEDIKLSLSARLRALTDLGLGYLTLSRGLGTVSGGEIQRCKIAKYMTSSLSDLVYILDEPSAGLHSRDIDRMIRAILALRDKGNTVLVVEHNRRMIEAADHIIDMGPGCGDRGGRIVFEGTYSELLKSGSPTGEALRRPVRLKPGIRRPAKSFPLRDLNYHNLKNVSVDIPLGVLCTVCGVAGAGKSSLMECFEKAYPDPVIFIDQKPVGANIRSTPATYLGALDELRSVFAKRCGAKASLFSFNSEGRCSVCGGKGTVVSDMAFMDSIETVCEACGGLRYSKEALAYTVDGLNIAEVMDLPAEKAAALYEGTPVAELLRPMCRVGLGYLHLNQALSTLSGGELQRLKLASHLNEKGSVFMLDEPMNGLHPNDKQQLLSLLETLADGGSSVIFSDHSMEAIACSDYVIELGPEGGDGSGRLLFAGTPEELMNCPNSVTAPYFIQTVQEERSRTC